ncbi:hypothetical protein D5086_033977, partial [Populus alba]
TWWWQLMAVGSTGQCQLQLLMHLSTALRGILSKSRQVSTGKMWKFQVRKPTSCSWRWKEKKLSSHQVGMWLMAAQPTILPLLPWWRKGFLARDITFQNTAGASKYQAVALRVESDFAAFYKCGMVAYQNTLHVHSNRQFFTNCYIAGTVDFIFGNSAAVFQDCDIRARRPNPGQTITITAQGRSDPNQNTGIVIQKSRIR